MRKRTIRACLITNPRSGPGAPDLSTVLPILYQNGWEVDIRQKLKGGMATDLARSAVSEGCDVVVGCGGDGTLNEIANGLVGTEVALGTLPGGTANVWAHEVGISMRLETAAHQLVGAARKHIDVGQVSINGGRRRCFLLMAGLGLDGAVMARVSKPLKHRLGRLAVGVAAVQAVPAYTASTVRVQIGETQWEGVAGQVVVGNTRDYGGFTQFTPDAVADDGLLDLCLITSSSALDLLRQASSMVRQHRPDARQMEAHRAGTVAVQAPHTLPLQLDGGVVKSKGAKQHGTVTYTFTVRRQALSVLVPATYSGALFQHEQAAQSLERRASAEHADHKADAALMDHRYQVVACGTTTITAARLRDGRVFTVQVGPQTKLRDADGTERTAAEFLASVSVGDTLQVRGKKDRLQGTLTASRMRAS